MSVYATTQENKMKNSTFQITALGLTIFLTFSLAWFIHENSLLVIQKASAQEKDLTNEDANEFEKQFISIEAPQNHQSIDVNGIRLQFGLPSVAEELDRWSAENFLSGPEQSNISVRVLKIPVCRPELATADWSYQDIKLETQIGEILVDRYYQSLDYFVRDSQGVQSHRCDVIGIKLADDFNATSFKISIGELKAVAPEIPDCNKIQALLDAENSKIKFECHTNNQSFSYSVIDKPATLREEDVRAKIDFT